MEDGYRTPMICHVREGTIASLCITLCSSFPVISRTRPHYVFQPSTWLFVSMRRVWFPMCTYTGARWRAIRRIRFASRVHAHAKSGRYLRIAATLVLKAHSVTPRYSRLIASAKPLAPKAWAGIAEKEQPRKDHQSKANNSFSVSFNLQWAPLKSDEWFFR